MTISRGSAFLFRYWGAGLHFVEALPSNRLASDIVLAPSKQYTDTFIALRDTITQTLMTPQPCCGKGLATENVGILRYQGTMMLPQLVGTKQQRSFKNFEDNGPIFGDYYNLIPDRTAPLEW